MEHALHLLILILITRLFGELFERFRQPASVGEIFAGVFLVFVAAVPFASPIIGNLPHSPFLEITAEFGIFFLILYAGIEIRPSELVSHSWQSLAIALGGVIVPLISGFLLAWVFLPETSLRFAQAFFVGVALSISAVPVAVKVLGEAGVLHHPVGRAVVSAALFDDILGLFLLAVVLSVIKTGAGLEGLVILFLIGKIVVFFGVTISFGYFLTPRIIRAASRFQIPAPEFSALLIIAFGFALFAEALGMDFILGSFMAGLFFDPKTIGEEAYGRVKSTIRMATDGLLAPLFFASIGARIDMSAVTTVPVFLAALLLIAFFGKLIGAGVPARLSGLSTRESAAVGIGLSGRGAVELIIASIALEAGLFNQPHPIVANLFSALVITAVVTTIIMPFGLRIALGRKRE